MRLAKTLLGQTTGIAMNLKEHIYAWFDDVGVPATFPLKSSVADRFIGWLRRSGVVPEKRPSDLDRVFGGYGFLPCADREIRHFSRDELRGKNLRRVAYVCPSELEGEIDSLFFPGDDVFMRATGESGGWLRRLITSDPDIRCVYHGPCFLDSRDPTFQLEGFFAGRTIALCGEDWIGVMKVRSTDLLVDVFRHAPGPIYGHFDCYSPVWSERKAQEGDWDIILSIPAARTDDENEEPHVDQKEFADPILREWSALPDGIKVTHFPRRVGARIEQKHGRPIYRWIHRTAVSSRNGPITIEEFGAFGWHDGQWVFSTITGKPFAQRDFADWYGCPFGRLEPACEYADAGNWSRSEALTAGKSRWIFVGTDSTGKRVKGDAIVEHLAELEECNESSRSD